MDSKKIICQINNSKKENIFSPSLFNFSNYPLQYNYMVYRESLTSSIYKKITDPIFIF